MVCLNFFFYSTVFKIYVRHFVAKLNICSYFFYSYAIAKKRAKEIIRQRDGGLLREAKERSLVYMVKIELMIVLPCI